MKHYPAVGDRVQDLHSYYRRWASEHLAEDRDDIAAFCHFLASEPGRTLRLDGVIWLDTALAGRDRLHRGDTGNSVAETLAVIVADSGVELSAHPASRTAMISIAARLVSGQISTAMGLQQRLAELP